MENDKNTVALATGDSLKHNISVVTTEKPKNKGRQEWGRKLGKMSKELKLKNQKGKSIVDFFSSWMENKFLLGIGIVVGIGALYY